MLVKPTVTQLLNKADNRYRLAIATAKRARQIYAGSRKLIKTSDTAPVSVAADEINADMLRIYNEEEWIKEQSNYENIKQQNKTIEQALKGENNISNNE